MTAQPVLAPLTPLAPRPVRTVATLGDSTTVGLGDPAPGGGWRGFAPLLAEAVGAATLVNPARSGARMADVRRVQLPVTLAAAPDAAVVCVGMNDTLRADFDPVGIGRDCAAITAALHHVGAHVVLIRYHDHTRVFRLPGRLRCALQGRIVALNAAIDAVAAADPLRISVLDLDVLQGGYDREMWAVDRLHPSERGHRALAAGMAGLLAGAGYAVPRPVGLECAGGREITAVHRVAWLLVKGVPWLVRRAHDLGPVLLQALTRG